MEFRGPLGVGMGWGVTWGRGVVADWGKGEESPCLVGTPQVFRN